MATVIPSFVHPYLVTNLDTYSYTVVNTGNHMVSVKLNDVVSLTNITVVIKQNSTTLVTASAPISTRNEINVETLVSAVANDVIGVVITSSATSDILPNQIKGYINIHQGSS